MRNTSNNQTRNNKMPRGGSSKQQAENAHGNSNAHKSRGSISESRSSNNNR